MPLGVILIRVIFIRSCNIPLFQLKGQIVIEEIIGRYPDVKGIDFKTQMAFDL